MENNEVVFNAVLKFINKVKTWDGTMTDLKSEVVSLDKNLKKEMPKNASIMGKTMHNLVYKLRSKGVSIKFRKSNGTRLISLKTSK